MTEDIHKDEIKPSDILMENTLDFQKWLNDPEAKNSFTEIIKDVPLANLDPKEMYLARNFADFMEQLRVMKLGVAKKYFQFQLLFLLNASLAKAGFAHKLAYTNIVRQDIERHDSIKASSGGWWNIGGNKGGK